jgi:hypothetical protein
MNIDSETAAAAAFPAEQGAPAAAAAAQYAHPLGFAGKVPKPKPYDGRASDADDWVFTMDNYLNINHAGNDYERIVVATYYLIRSAALQIPGITQDELAVRLSDLLEVAGSIPSSNTAEFFGYS